MLVKHFQKFRQIAQQSIEKAKENKCFESDWHSGGTGIESCEKKLAFSAEIWYNNRVW